MLPTPLRNEIESRLGAEITAETPVSGGDINRAPRITLADGRTVFAKWHAAPPAGMFAAEAFGLELLANAQALHVPQVFFHTASMLVMEWLGRGNRPNRQIAHQLGEKLAAQHRFLGEYYGLEHDNFCGLTPQRNTPTANWVTFFGEHRLGFQMELAAQRGRLPSARTQRLETLIARLGDFLPAQPPASLLHGDLWGGNWLVAENGEPALIDPAVYFGHCETDLAFTELFGGFSVTFYKAYRATYPLEAGYNTRKEIYNLYHLLNHLNLFGESYGRQVDIVLKKFT